MLHEKTGAIIPISLMHNTPSFRLVLQYNNYERAFRVFFFLFSFEATVEMVRHVTFCCNVLNFGGNFAAVFTLKFCQNVGGVNSFVEKVKHCRFKSTWFNKMGGRAPVVYTRSQSATRQQQQR